MVTAVFIKELVATSINCAYSQNIRESGGICNMYGLAPRSVNLDRMRKSPYIANADTFAPSGAIPTGWNIAYNGGVTTTTTAISPYGGGASVIITPTNQYIYQQITVPANALIRIAVYAVCDAGGEADLQLWDIGLTGKLGSASTTNSVATRLEYYLSPAARSNATSFILILRNTGAVNVQFCGIELEDMTN